MARIIPELPPVATAVTRLELTNDPTIKGKAAAVAWYRDVMGVSNIGLGLVTKATNDRSLPSYKISGAIWYSTVEPIQLCARNEEKRMTDIDPKRAAALRRKYGMNEPPQKDNPVVGRILAAERLHGRVFTRDTDELFDPVRNEKMHARAVDALHDLHTGIASGVITRDSHDPDSYGRDRLGEPFTPDEPELLVHVVGTGTAMVIRGAKRLDAFDRATRDHRPARRGVEYFSGMYRLMMELHVDFWETPCNVNVARKCFGAPQLLPYMAGTVVLIFAICDRCLQYTEDAATIGYELSVMEAHARAGLPFP